MATALYRYFNAADDLLYVGISNSPFMRYHQHGTEKNLSEIVLIEIEWFELREDAVAAEKLAIERERPAWNKALLRRQRERRKTEFPPEPLPPVQHVDPEFQPDHEKDYHIWLLYREDILSDDHVLRRAREIMGWKVEHHHLWHRYGGRRSK